MRPASGDLIVLKDTATGRALRDGTILDTRGDELRPVYLVQWSDSGDLEMYIADERAYVRRFDGDDVEEFSLSTGFASSPPDDGWDDL